MLRNAEVCGIEYVKNGLIPERLQLPKEGVKMVLILVV